MAQDLSPPTDQPPVPLNCFLENKNFRDKTMTLSGDGRTLAVWDDGIIKVWRFQESLFSESAPEQNPALRQLENLGQEEQLAPLAQLSQNSCASIALSNDGQTLASGTREGEVWLWQVSTKTSRCLSSRHSNLVMSVAFSHDGSILASGNHEKIKYWNVGNYRQIDDIFRGFGWIYTLAFSPKGDLLASTSEARIYLWDLNLKQRRDPLTLEPRNQITALVFNPVQQNQIACGTRGGKIVLLNLDNREIPLTISAHSQRVNLLAFSPNGKTLISGSSDGSFKSWQIATLPPIPSGDWLDLLPDDASSDYIEKESKKYVHPQGHSTDEKPSNISKLMVLTDEEFKKELQDLLKARVPLIFLRSSEEERAINYVIHAHRNAISKKDADGELARWSSIDGFSRSSFTPESAESPKFVNWNKIESSISLATTTTSQGALTFLSQQLETASKENECQFTYILPDWPAFLEERSPNSQTLTRQLKELTIALKERESQPRMTIIILGSNWLIPATLRDHVHLVNLLPPRGEEIEPVFKEVLPKDWNLELVVNLAKDAQGMPLQVARQAAQLIKTKKINNLKEAQEILLKIKQQEVKKTGVLEYCVPQGNGLADVGGLDNLKSWLKERQRWFEQNDAPKLRPRAILLEGFPGCGKSFIANAIAKEWNVPQINFEISRLKSKYVGETENKTIEALRAIDTSAPCILFIDEIEKAFAGVTSDSSGVSTNQFGTFLSWLNDHQSPVFVIVTSNDSEKLPPELFRPGRFDKRFIFLLPNPSERCQILQNRIQAYGLNIEPDFSINKLNSELNLEGFSGAEIDQLVKEAIYQRPQQLPPRLPTPEEWKKAREQIHPQIKNPSRKKLLQQYIDTINADGESASKLDEEYLEELKKLVQGSIPTHNSKKEEA